MKKLLLYGMGITLSMAVATVTFAGNDKKDGKKECTTKEKKECKSKCNGSKECCKDHKSCK